MPRERDVLEVDVLFVGAGPASLGGAIRLAQLYREHNDAVKAGTKTGPQLSSENILVIDKAKNVGDHGISGAVLDPRGMIELFGDFLGAGCPVESPVTSDEFWLLSKSERIKAPFLPPPMNNHGKYVASLNKLVKWLARQAEALGVQVFAAISAGQELLYDGDRVIGVQNWRQGCGPQWSAKTKLRSGPRSSCQSGCLRRRSARHACQAARPQTPTLKGTQSAGLFDRDQRAVADAERVDSRRSCDSHARVSVRNRRRLAAASFILWPTIFGTSGIVVGLDYRDPLLEPHAEFQKFKEHPSVAALLAGGQMFRYGAKAIPEGGWWSMPRPFADGVLLVGDTAGMLNPMRLKGIHLALKSGMLAAETCLERHPATIIRLQAIKSASNIHGSGQSCTPHATSIKDLNAAELLA